MIVVAPALSLHALAVILAGLTILLGGATAVIGLSLPSSGKRLEVSHPVRVLQQLTVIAFAFTVLAGIVGLMLPRLALESLVGSLLFLGLALVCQLAANYLRRVDHDGPCGPQRGRDGERREKRRTR